MKQGTVKFEPMLPFLKRIRQEPEVISQYPLVVYLCPRLWRAHLWGMLLTIVTIGPLMTIAALLVGAFSMGDLSQKCTSALIMLCALESGTIYLCWGAARGWQACMSTVTFGEASLLVQNRRGKLWREIRYDEISLIRREPCAGYLFGNHNRTEDMRTPFISLCLHGMTKKPAAMYPNQLFRHQDYFMIQEVPEVWAELEKRMQELHQ